MSGESPLVFGLTIIDVITILFISIFFVMEIKIMVSHIMGKKESKTGSHLHVKGSVIRPAFFLFIFGLYISISFVPLYMEKLYVPIFGISKDMALGLPVSVFVLSTGVSFFISGIWSDERGWHEPFFAGIFLSIAGHLYSFGAPDGRHFIIAQGITGMGYGLAFMASQGFVIAFSHENRKGSGLSLLFAALYSGIICSSATGAMLAEQFGYRYVFIFGAALIVCAGAYSFLFMQREIKESKKRWAPMQVNSFDKGRLFQFLLNKKVAALVLLGSIPANMAMIGFINYFNPVYLSRMGVSQSNIGRMFMIYGGCFVFVGPIITRFADKSNNKKGYIIAGGLLGSLAFINFIFFSGITASIIAILALGISQSFIFATFASFILTLEVSRDLGEGKAIAVFRSLNQMGQAMGPMIFGWLIVVTDIRKGILCFGFAYLLLTLILLLLSPWGQMRWRIRPLWKGRAYANFRENRSHLPEGGASNSQNSNYGPDTSHSRRKKS